MFLSTATKTDSVAACTSLWDCWGMPWLDEAKAAKARVTCQLLSPFCGTLFSSEAKDCFWSLHLFLEGLEARLRIETPAAWHPCQSGLYIFTFLQQYDLVVISLAILLVCHFLIIINFVVTIYLLLCNLEFQVYILNESSLRRLIVVDTPW